MDGNSGNIGIGGPCPALDHTFDQLDQRYGNGW